MNEPLAGSTAQSPDEGPPVVSNHTLHRCIGKGAYGTVWLANDAMGKWRAVKVVSRRDAGRSDSGYEREWKAVARYEEVSLDESLMPIRTVGRDPQGRFFYYSMDLADDARTGDPLPPLGSVTDERLAALIDGYQPWTIRLELNRRGRFSTAECVAHGSALATALEKLHAHQLIHRDIKPDNIILVHRIPKLADVGLVADVDATYSMAGTAAYLSPEPERKQAADIFALGKVLYEMATGQDVEKFPRPPKDLGTFSEADRTEFNELNAIVLKACQPAIRDRYASAAELRHDLALLSQGVSIRRQHNLERTIKQFWFLTRTVGPAVLLGICGLWLWIHQNQMALRQALLSQARLERRREHLAGWSDANWALIQKAAAIRSDSEVLDQAAGTLADLDAKVIYAFSNAPGGSAVFGPNDTLLVGGAMGSPALLIETNGVKRELPTRAEGPLCWTAEGVPLQFSAPSNVCLLQEVVSGQVRRQFALGEGERVNRTIRPVLAMNATGTRVAAGINNGLGDSSRVVVWDAINGKALADAAVYARALAFSDDGSVLAVGDTNGSIIVYSFPGMGMTRLMELPPPGGPTQVHCLAMAQDRLFREDGANPKSQIAWLVAASYKGGDVDIWDLHTRMPRAVCRGSRWSVTSLAFHPDGLMLATGGRNGEVRFWDVMTGSLLLQIYDPTTVDARALAFNSAGTRLAWATEASPPPESSSFWKWTRKDSMEEYPRFEGSPPSVTICELSRQRGVHVLRGLTTSVHKVWFSSDSSLVAALSDNWQVAVWEPRGGRLIAIFKVPEGGFTDSAGGAFDLAGQHFAFATGTRARLYELATGHVAQQWALPKSGLMDQLQFDGRGRLLLLRRGPDNEPANRRRWQLYQLPFDSKPVLLHQQSETNWVPYQTAFAPGGERFFVWSYEPISLRPILRAFEVANGRQLWQATPTGIVYPSTLLDPTGRWFAYLVNTRNFHLMRLSDFQDFGFLPTELQALGPTGDQFVFFNGPNVFNGPNGLLVCGRGGPAKGLPLGSDWTRSSPVAFSVDGRLVAWGTEQGAVLVADILEVRRRLSELGR